MPPDSPAAIIERDRITPMSDDDLDDAMWLALLDRISEPAQLAGFDPAVEVYFATRLVEWDTMNGGVAQAVYNNVEWFLSALEGYRALANPAALAFFGDAVKVIESNVDLINDARASEDGYFRLLEHADFSALDERLGEEADEISSDEARVRWLRTHHDAFTIA